MNDTTTNTQPATQTVTGKPGEISVQQIVIDEQSLRVAIRHGGERQPPLLLFNGIGANWELAKPLLEALTSTTAIIFDVPGRRRLAAAASSVSPVDAGAARRRPRRGTGLR
ncbi:hypothetical protein [Bradyrhizobium sp. AS23.2]|uniref:alpha/beta fold hydrolase n=1 Tax=Bradyrhizobium sp. AS23.2 TaxID=1680155 RepID=UPI001AD84CAF|nr:hypothetical protein [Bradyrhizobium sp. AS23.2]